MQTGHVKLAWLPSIFPLKLVGSGPGKKTHGNSKKRAGVMRSRTKSGERFFKIT